MQKKNFIFFVFLSCVAGYASEHDALLPRAEEVRQRATKKHLDRAFEDQTSVWVMVVRNGQRYAKRSDVIEKKIRWLWCGAGPDEVCDMTMSVMDFLKHQALQGYKTRFFCEPQTDFRKECKSIGGAVSVLRYKRCEFPSHLLQYVLSSLWPDIEKKGRGVWDGCGQYLTDDVLKSFAPTADQRMVFSLRSQRQALAEMLSAKESDPMKVFVPLPGFCVLKGCIVPYKSMRGREVSVSPQCFLYHKMEAMEDIMRERYPFDEEVWKTCLNYDEDFRMAPEWPEMVERLSPYKESDCEWQLMVTRALGSALEAQTSVWVMVVHGGQRYTGFYDVCKEKSSWRCKCFDGEEVTLIMPVMEALTHEILQSYEVRRLFSPQTDFSKELDCTGGSLNKLRYKRCAFFSEYLRIFLTVLCARLEKKGKVAWGGCGKRLTGSVLSRLDPPSGQWLSFIVQSKDSALAEMRSTKDGDPIKVFMTLPGFSVVKGCAVLRQPWRFARETEFSRASFLFHKVEAMKDTLRARYPFDEESWKSCLDYPEAEPE